MPDDCDFDCFFFYLRQSAHDQAINAKECQEILCGLRLPSTFYIQSTMSIWKLKMAAQETLQVSQMRSRELQLCRESVRFGYFNFLIALLSMQPSAMDKDFWDLEELYMGKHDSNVEELMNQ